MNWFENHLRTELAKVLSLELRDLFGSSSYTSGFLRIEFDEDSFVLRGEKVLSRTSPDLAAIAALFEHTLIPRILSAFEFVASDDLGSKAINQRIKSILFRYRILYMLSSFL